MDVDTDRDVRFVRKSEARLDATAAGCPISSRPTSARAVFGSVAVLGSAAAFCGVADAVAGGSQARGGEGEGRIEPAKVLGCAVEDLTPVLIG